MNYGNWSICTGNSIIDSVLSIKLISIKELGISFRHEIFLPEAKYIPLNDVKLSSLLGNALDNAIEACQKVDASTTPYIHIIIKPIKSTLFIEIQNSSINNYQYMPDKQLNTTKLIDTKNHGIGLKRITTIVTETGGFYKIEPAPEHFTLTLILPFKNNL